MLRNFKEQKYCLFFTPYTYTINSIVTTNSPSIGFEICFLSKFPSLLNGDVLERSQIYYNFLVSAQIFHACRDAFKRRVRAKGKFQLSLNSRHFSFPSHRPFTTTEFHAFKFYSTFTLPSRPPSSLLH